MLGPSSSEQCPKSYYMASRPSLPRASICREPEIQGTKSNQQSTVACGATPWRVARPLPMRCLVFLCARTCMHLPSTAVGHTCTHRPPRRMNQRQTGARAARIGARSTASTPRRTANPPLRNDPQPCLPLGQQTHPNQLKSQFKLWGNTPTVYIEMTVVAVRQHTS